MKVSMSYAYRKQFRYYTRLVYTHRTNAYYHKKRISIAMKLEQSEPLQGALADYFFGCWHEVAKDGALLLSELSEHLPTHILQEFHTFVATGVYLPAISALATRFSVLVSPSMNVPKYKLYMNKDDAKLLSQKTSQAILLAKQNNNEAELLEIEESYFHHCMACHDRMGFMMTWFALAKEGFEFDQRWLGYRQKLE